MKAYVLARKGVLISNPDVARMSTAQWLFEYHALQEKEKASVTLTAEVFKESATLLRKILVSLFGNDIVGQDKIIPLSLLIGNPDLLKKWMDIAEQEAKGEEAALDDDFDAISAKLAKGDTGDLDPVLFGDMGKMDNLYFKSEEYRNALKSIGIKLTK